MSDGCTGFQWLEGFFEIRQCCVIHDAGGSDGVLLDCLLANTPPEISILVVFCVFLMALFRPIYRMIKPYLKRK
ncbi:hypothetical protein [uncultured Maritalea sp.]|uniref:hypothetical protein n=1 Tax=uncultured Maritalea sp. TaxID=757249 RepID=UPI00262CC8E5|nr:hypothetical protein [uncultured Maritalea sp.]